MPSSLPPPLDRDLSGFRASQRMANWMMGAFLLSWLDRPWHWLALGAVVMAIVHGVRALMSLRGPRTAPMRTWVVVGLVLSSILLGYLLTPLVVSPWTRDYDECVAAANTNLARAQCRQQHGSRLTDWLEGIRE